MPSLPLIFPPAALSYRLPWRAQWRPLGTGPEPQPPEQPPGPPRQGRGLHAAKLHHAGEGCNTAAATPKQTKLRLNGIRPPSFMSLPCRRDVPPRNCLTPSPLTPHPAPRLAPYLLSPHVPHRHASPCRRPQRLTPNGESMEATDGHSPRARRTEGDTGDPPRGAGATPAF